MRKTVLLLASAALLVLLVSGVALALALDCSTDPARACTGTPEDDEIIGSATEDHIRALVHDQATFSASDRCS